jgi:hypothetical protein
MAALQNVAPSEPYALMRSGQAEMLTEERGPRRIHSSLVLIVQLQRVGSVTHEAQGRDGSAHGTGPLFGVGHAREEHHCVLLRRDECVLVVWLLQAASAPETASWRVVDGRSAGDAYLAARFASHCRKRDWRSQSGSG